MRKKTIAVETVQKQINDMLTSDQMFSQETKRTLCTLLESILMATGNYRGFGNIYWLNEGFNRWKDAGSVQGTQKDYEGPEYNRIYY